MREWFSGDRFLSWRSVWPGFTALILACSIAVQSASAQDKASILERAEEVANFLELLEHENSIVRQMSIADGLASDNRYIRDAAIEAGFNSDDVMVRKEAIAGVLTRKPFFIVEIPIELDEKLADHSLTQWWMIARLEVDTKYFDPDRFVMNAQSNRSDVSMDCVLRSDEVLCRSQRSRTSLTLRPGASGNFVGELDADDWRLPVTIRNF
ncbi:MAG: hypothetical protein AAFV59_03710 [Pseudomonadota bacterium]